MDIKNDTPANFDNGLPIRNHHPIKVMLGPLFKGRLDRIIDKTKEEEYLLASKTYIDTKKNEFKAIKEESDIKTKNLIGRLKVQGEQERIEIILKALEHRDSAISKAQDSPNISEEGKKERIAMITRRYQNFIDQEFQN